MDHHGKLKGLGMGGMYRTPLHIVRHWGGETYHKVPPPNPVLEASENGIRLVSARFL